MEKYSTYERNERKVKEYNAWRIVKSISKFLHFLHLSSVVTTLIFTLLNFHNILVTAQIPNFINSGSAVGSGLAISVKCSLQLRQPGSRKAAGSDECQSWDKVCC